MSGNKFYFQAIKNNAKIFYRNVSRNVDEFIMELYQENVITGGEKQELLKLVKNPEKVCDTLLNLLEKRSDEDSFKVIEALKATGNTDIADSIMATYKQISGGGQGGEKTDSKYKLPEEKGKLEINHANSVKIARLLSKEPGFVDKWNEFYSLLLGEKYQAEKLTMQRGVNNGTCNMYDVATTTLQRWVSSSGDGATLQTIYKCLVDCDLENFAGKILQNAPNWE